MFFFFVGTISNLSQTSGLKKSAKNESRHYYLVVSVRLTG